MGRLLLVSSAQEEQEVLFVFLEPIAVQRDAVVDDPGPTEIGRPHGLLALEMATNQCRRAMRRYSMLVWSVNGPCKVCTVGQSLMAPMLAPTGPVWSCSRSNSPARSRPRWRGRPRT